MKIHRKKTCVIRQTLLSKIGLILGIFILFSCESAHSLILLPDRDIVSPQDRNYTLYMMPELPYTSLYVESKDYTISYNSQQNSTHAWATFSIPESLSITYQYKIFVYLLNSYGDTISNGTFRFIIADNLSDEQLWFLWGKYDEYEQTIEEQQGIIDDQNATIGDLNKTVDELGGQGKSLEEQALPFLKNMTLFFGGAFTVSFIAFLGVTKLKKKKKELTKKYGNLQDDYRSQLQQNRMGSLSLLAVKPHGSGRPMPIISLVEEIGAVKMLREDPELPDFLQVDESNDEKNSLDHLKNLFTTNKYTPVYKDKMIFQLHCMNALIRYCHNYGYTGEEGTLYPKGCTLKDLEEYRDQIYAKIKQYSDAGKYIPAAMEEQQLKAKVNSAFRGLPEPPEM